MPVANQFIAPGADFSILTKNYVQDAARIQDFAGFSQTWNNMATFTRNNVDGTETANFSSNFLLGYILQSVSNIIGHDVTATRPTGVSKLRVGTNPELSNKEGSNTAGFYVQNGGVGSALGVPQIHLRSVDVDAGIATVNSVLTLTATNGEAEFKPLTAAPIPTLFARQIAINFSGSAGSVSINNENAWSGTAALGVVPLGGPITNTMGANGTLAANVFTANVAGLYEVTLTGSFTGLSAGQSAYIQLIKNLTSIQSAQSVTANGITQHFEITVTTAVQLAAGDTIVARMGGDGVYTAAVKSVSLLIKKIG